MTAPAQRMRRPLQEVTPGVWVATAERWETTSTVVVGDAGDCLVVDPALTAAERGALAAEIERRGWRVVAGFSTHPHWDHVLGTVAFPGVPHWAMPEAAAWAVSHAAELAEQLSHELPGEDLSGAGDLTRVPADVTLPWVGPSAVPVALPGHSVGHAALHLPDHRALLVGDMVSDREVPLLDLDDAVALSHYSESLDAIAMLLDEGGVELVIPGHGRVATRAEALVRIDADRRYLDDLQEGHPSADPRLADEWVRAEHERQRRHFGC
ncbi:MBL fold metallo-hydrolase [Georgenia sp. MJ206]|uniref:MBL fold metallo-hydrolase n=1 Tax=Georgenia wangjunii TaxID=3117730 RepID=UPI002F26D526